MNTLSQAETGTKQLHQTGLIVLLGVLAAIGPLSIDMYLPAFPGMAAALHAPIEAVEATLAAYFAGLSCGQLLYGPLADRYGRQWPLFGGLALYTCASVACALVQDVETMIALRFLQALGACGGMVISRAIVTDRYQHHEAARVFSSMMLVMGIAPILAPFLGGYLSGTFGWRSIFWVLFGFSLVCLVGTNVWLRDLRGADPSIRLRRTLPTYLSILRDRRFLRYALAGSIGQAGMFAYITASPHVFIEVFGIPPERFGWVFGINAFGLIAMAQISARMLRKHGSDQILKLCFASLAVAGVCLIGAAAAGGGPVLVGIPLFIYIATLGATRPNTSAGALAQQGKHAGSASALLGTLQMMAAALASYTVSRIPGPASLAMAGVVGACGVGGLLVFRWLRPAA